MTNENKAKTPLIEDWHLWSKVTSSINPIKGKKFIKEKKNSLVLSQTNKNKSIFRSRKPASVFMPSYTPTFSKPKQSHENIEPSLHRRLIRNKISIDATIDLHDLRQDEAHSTLASFLSRAYNRQHRNILVITGKGKKIEQDYGFGIAGQRGVLRAMLPIWLKQANFRQIVSGYEIAGKAHGGSGAFYVRLKRQK